jgi:hypothetical protein
MFLGRLGIVVPHMSNLSSRGEEEFVDVVRGLEGHHEAITVGGDVQE